MFMRFDRKVVVYFQLLLSAHIHDYGYAFWCLVLCSLKGLVMASWGSDHTLLVWLLGWCEESIHGSSQMEGWLSARCKFGRFSVVLFRETSWGDSNWMDTSPEKQSSCPDLTVIQRSDKNEPHVVPTQVQPEIRQVHFINLLPSWKGDGEVHLPSLWSPLVVWRRFCTRIRWGHLRKHKLECGVNPRSSFCKKIFRSVRVVLSRCPTKHCNIYTSLGNGPYWAMTFRTVHLAKWFVARDGPWLGRPRPVPAQNQAHGLLLLKFFFLVEYYCWKFARIRFVLPFRSRSILKQKQLMMQNFISWSYE